MELTFAIAFIGGVVSFLSPCMLPLVPVYLGYLSGQVSHTSQATLHIRLRAFIHSLIFVAGFTLVFVAIGLLSTVFIEQVSGETLDATTTLIGRVGGLIVLLFGLHFLGVLPRLFNALRRVNALSPLVAFSDQIFYGSIRFQPRIRGVSNYSGSLLIGMALAAGWTPCIGPVYGAVLTLGLNGGDVGQVGVLMLIYSLGLGLPFILAALTLGSAQSWLTRLKRGMRTVERVSGVFLIVLGLALLTGQLQSASRRFANQFADVSIAIEEAALNLVSPDRQESLP